MIASHREELIPEIEALYPDTIYHHADLAWKNQQPTTISELKSFAKEYPGYTRTAYNKLARLQPEEAKSWFLENSQGKKAKAEAIESIVGPYGSFSREPGPDDPFSGPTIDHLSAVEWLTEATSEGLPTNPGWLSLLEHQAYRSPAEEIQMIFSNAPSTVQEQFQNHIYGNVWRDAQQNIEGVSIIQKGGWKFNKGLHILKRLDLLEKFESSARAHNERALEQLRQKLLSDE